MKKQEFKITVRLTAEVESAGKPFLTEDRVRKQVERFLKSKGITDSLPCHGTGEFRVTDVIEIEEKG